MSDYIKKEDTREAIRETCRNLNYLTPPVYQLTGAIDKVPSADVVEVVRCKNCKHLYKDGECPLRTWFTHDEDDYCSYGERKEDEQL